jgi:hypothetical protein
VIVWHVGFGKQSRLFAPGLPYNHDCSNTFVQQVGKTNLPTCPQLFADLHREFLNKTKDFIVFLAFL